MTSHPLTGTLYEIQRFKKSSYLRLQNIKFKHLILHIIILKILTTYVQRNLQLNSDFLRFNAVCRPNKACAGNIMQSP